MIKPIEKNEIEPPSKKSVFIASSIILAVIAGTVLVHNAKDISSSSSSFLKQISQKTAELGSAGAKVLGGVGGAVLGETTKFGQDIASKSAETATNYVLSAAAKAIADQIEKLPDAQKKELKNYLCK